MYVVEWTGLPDEGSEVEIVDSRVFSDEEQFDLILWVKSNAGTMVEGDRMTIEKG